ncbi:MAG: pantoate--beta-alanine ligase, partial [Chitinophagaceae bacterium]|nr:pantoate--beta-alanine ligase [Chitinophagaceae bacterium]
DIEQLVLSYCDVLFYPLVDEVYPPGYSGKQYDLGKIETILEGKFRPGHFQGVCQVMDRLLHIVEPGTLYLGQKDYQQCLVIKKLVQLLGKENEIKLNFVETKREPDGLAMSSRNLRLTPEQRQKAVAIFKCLTFIKENYLKADLLKLKKCATDTLTSEGFNVDYVEIADAEDLRIVAHPTSRSLVALVAATIGGVRLIDNILLN